MSKFLWVHKEEFERIKRWKSEDEEESFEDSSFHFGTEDSLKQVIEGYSEFSDWIRFFSWEI